MAMQHPDSDNQELVLRVESDLVGVKRYDKAQRTFLGPPLPRLLTRVDAMFKELVGTLEMENAWVRSGTWSLVDRRVELRKAPSACRSSWTGKSGRGRRARPS